MDSLALVFTVSSKWPEIYLGEAVSYMSGQLLYPGHFPWPAPPTGQADGLGQQSLHVISAMQGMDGLKGHYHKIF